MSEDIRSKKPSEAIQQIANERFGATYPGLVTADSHQEPKLEDVIEFLDRVTAHDEPEPDVELGPGHYVVGEKATNPEHNSTREPVRFASDKTSGAEPIAPVKEGTEPNQPPEIAALGEPVKEPGEPPKEGQGGGKRDDAGKGGKSEKAKG